MIILVVIVWSLVCQIVFSGRSASYQWKAQTISELASRLSADRKKVALVYFLPVALLLTIQWLTWFHETQWGAGVSALLFMMPLSYFAAAIFPCDEGAPFIGTLSNNLHMAAGFLQYTGTISGLVAILLSFEFSMSLQWALVFLVAAISGGFLSMLLPSLLLVRGGIQRVTEFASLLAWLLLSIYI